MAAPPVRAAAALADSEYAFQLQVQEAARASLASASCRPPAAPDEKLAAEMTAVSDKAAASPSFSDCLRIYRDAAKFIFKLFARGAIVRKEDCAICFEDADVSEMFSVDECLHRYCFSCMKKHVEAKLNDGAAVKCPHDGCGSKIAIESCEKLLGANLVSIMSQRVKEASVPPAERVYCPRPRCSALMSKGQVLEYSEASSILSAASRGFSPSRLNLFHRNKNKASSIGAARKCIVCGHFFCIDCMVPWHYDLSCVDYRASKRNRASVDVKLKYLASQKLWRQCINCNNMVELDYGCYHITCRCGYEFCYTCGAIWVNKKPTCKCPLWDECNLIRGVGQQGR